MTVQEAVAIYWHMRQAWPEVIESPATGELQPAPNARGEHE